MKIPAYKIDEWCKKPDPAIQTVLLYGPDAGLIKERGRRLALTVAPQLDDPFRVTELEGADCLADPARLADELAAQAFGGGRRLIWLKSCPDSLAAILNQALADKKGDNFLLIESDDLPKKSKLRALAEDEAAKNIIALACYEDDEKSRVILVGNLLKEAGITWDADARAKFMSLVPPDRLAMKQEVEKLITYVGQDKQITLPDIEKLFGDAAAVDLDDLVFAASDQSTKKIHQFITRLWAEQTAPVAVIRAAARHFTRLYEAKMMMQEGTSAEEAVKRLSPPVFWKRQDQMIGALRRLEADYLSKKLRDFVAAEKAMKQTGAPDTALCERCLLS
jgi:DNA polymerase III subunit delta